VAKGLDTRATAVSEITTEQPGHPDPGRFRHGGARRDAIPAFPAPAGDGRQQGHRHGRHPGSFRGGEDVLEEDIQETEAFVFGDQYGA